MFIQFLYVLEVLLYITIILCVNIYNNRFKNFKVYNSELQFIAVRYKIVFQKTISVSYENVFIWDVYVFNREMVMCMYIFSA